jgi:hypothetical protein
LILNFKFLKFDFMKSFICLILFFLLSRNISAQYVPLPENNAYWTNYLTAQWANLNENGWSHIWSNYLTGNDTVINSIDYVQLICATRFESFNSSSGMSAGSTSYQYIGAFRNDANTKKVFYIPKNDTAEKLLYDFNLSLGDTVSNWYNITYPAAVGVVSQIDSVYLDSQYLQRFRFFYNQYDTIYLIEGIGLTSGLLSAVQYVGAVYEDLLCFGVGNMSIYPNSNQFCGFIGISEKSASTLNVFPNPTSGILKLGEIERSAIIFNQFGSRVMRIDDDSGFDEIDLTDLPAGIYYCSLSSGENYYQAFKIIKY